MQTKFAPLGGLIALVLSSLACSVFVGGPELPAAPAGTASGVLESVQAALERATSDSLATGKLELELSQEQINALVESFFAGQNPPLLEEPQVVLGDQEMTLYGRAQSGLMQANAAVSMSFSVDPDGKPAVHIGEAELGPWPMPEALKETLASTIDEAFTGSIGPAAIGFRLEAIEISPNGMKITGRVR